MNATDSLAEPDPPSQLVPRIHSSLNSDFFASLSPQLQGPWLTPLYILGAQHRASHTVGFL